MWYNQGVVSQSIKVGGVHQIYKSSPLPKIDNGDNMLIVLKENKPDQGYPSSE